MNIILRTVKTTINFTNTIIGFEMASYIGISFPSNAISLEICTLSDMPLK